MEEGLTPKKRGFKFKCYMFFKRAFDIFASLTFLLLFCWLYLIIAIAVKLSDGGKVFYRHERVGKGGKTIYLTKFRSMKKNADKLEDMLTPEELELYKKEFKVENDSRVTKLGKFLRKTSLDELPNVFSILKGDITLVGPRPIMRIEAEEKYGDKMDELLSVRPGMIGWWAASGRNEITYESGKRQEMELYYVNNCSVWFDIKIFFKTIGGVLKRRGAK
ncbi:MAG: sugar transferase [Clostridia bacterium]|nr:sugar transferase [Clostridia bacterium]